VLRVSAEFLERRIKGEFMRRGRRRRRRRRKGERGV
jgi:hypothetical protein